LASPWLGPGEERPAEKSSRSPQAIHGLLEEDPFHISSRKAKLYEKLRRPREKIQLMIAGLESLSSLISA
jgi:hypothetical protein